MTQETIEQVKDPKEMQNMIAVMLRATERQGVESMLAWMEKTGFFVSPASTRYHGCYAGGLARHSLNVYALLDELNGNLDIGCPQESLVIATLLHDVCKVGAYLGSTKPYSWNRAQPKGHAMLSLLRIQPHIQLNELETKMIKFHMGIYGLQEFEMKKGEYTLRGGGMANAWHHHPIVKLMYFCDELASFSERADEQIEH